MKLSWLLYPVVIALPVLGWLAPPVAMMNMADSCVARSVAIYDEPGQTLFTRARWYSEAGRNNHNYSAQLIRVRPGQPEETLTAERTFVTDSSFSTRFIHVTTQRDHRISGPVSSGEWPGSYIDPLAEKGFSASVWLFHAGQSWLTGFEGRPRGICQPAAQQR